MADLKNTIVNGFLKVNGVIESDTNKTNFTEDVYEISYAKLIDPSVLDEEVELFTVPDGYRARIVEPGSFAYVAVTYSQTSGSITTDSVITLSGNIEASPGVQTWTATIGNTYFVTYVSTSPWLDEGVFSAKVTTAGVGFTDKALVSGRVLIIKK